MKLLCIFFICIAYVSPLISQSVNIHYSASSLQQQYASSKLEKALLEKGYKIKQTYADYEIDLTINSQLSKEAFSIRPSTKKIIITGGDERGLIYGCFSLAEDVRN